MRTVISPLSTTVSEQEVPVCRPARDLTDTPGGGSGTCLEETPGTLQGTSSGQSPHLTSQYRALVTSF